MWSLRYSRWNATLLLSISINSYVKTYGQTNPLPPGARFVCPVSWRYEKKKFRKSEFQDIMRISYWITFHVLRWCKIRPKFELWLSKLAACTYGLTFLALAFLAEYLGGVLQAAMTIFGAVGGPLLGVFTLGMFTTYANEAVNICSRD